MRKKSESRLLDIRFTVSAALALGLPALMGAAVYLAPLSILTSNFPLRRGANVIIVSAPAIAPNWGDPAQRSRGDHTRLGGFVRPRNMSE